MEIPMTGTTSAGTVRLADDLVLTRMGYGAIQLAGPMAWGPPRDREAAQSVLRAVVDLGITHIDTSDYYGPHVVNQLIREALHPYPDDLVIVTKVGAVRGADAAWNPALTRLYPLSPRWYKWALYDRDPLERWAKGRATLLGDSAHAMLPYLGQGAGMAIEDGCVLAAMIARHGEDLDAALSAYERLRVPRTKATVLGSRARAKENHLASPWARLKRDVKFALRERFGSGDTTAFKVGWLYEYDVGREMR